MYNGIAATGRVRRVGFVGFSIAEGRQRAKGDLGVRGRGLLFLAVLGAALAACSSSSGGGGLKGTSTKVSGAVVDAYILNATVTAYEVESSGALGPCVPASPGPCATATTDATGNYTVDLGSYAGPVLMESTGGSYTDTVTGQTVPVPSGVTLSSFIPAVTSGQGTVTAQITGITTIAASLALEQMAPPLSLSAADASTAANTQVDDFFGLQNTATTALLDLASPGCAGSGASQASFDASLLLAGLSELANQYGVTTIDLMNAIVTDMSSNGGSLTGLIGGGSSITIGSAAIPLSLIEGTSLGTAIENSITTFVGSVKNACNVTQSSTQKSALAATPPAPSAKCASSTYCYSATVNYTGPAGVSLTMPISLGCSDDKYGSTAAGFRGSASAPSGNGSFTIAATAAAPSSYAGSQNYEYRNDCGTNTAKVELATGGFQPVNCSISPTQLSFTSSDGGFHNTATSAVTVSCSYGTYTVSGLVTGLPSGSNLVLEDSTNGDTVTVTANGPFTLPAQIGVGTGYDVRVKTQPAGLPAGAQCTVANGQSNSIQGPVSNVIVSCPVQQISARLNNPNGLAFSGGKLYVANPGSSQILVFEESSTTTSASLGLADIIAGPSGISGPGRLAFDPSGRYLFATYGAQGAAGEVLVYDTQSGNAKIQTISNSAIVGPLGVAVDASGNVYVAENTTNAISVFTPTNSTDPSQGYSLAFSLTSDGASNSFSAPGAIAYYAWPTNGDYLFVGLGSGTVLVYPIPFSRTPNPVATISCSGGVTGISVSSGSSIFNTTAYVTYYYSSSAAGYNLFNAFGRAACPTPSDKATGLSSPEGIAIDASGNVIIANASINKLLIYSPSLSSALLSYGP